MGKYPVKPGDGFAEKAIIFAKMPHFEMLPKDGEGLFILSLFRILAKLWIKFKKTCALASMWAQPQ
jgi:hypothetical protein